MILSPAIVIELAKKLRTKFAWDESAIQQTLRTLVRHADIVPSTAIPGAVPNDPDDEAIIAAAVTGHADVIVSGDRHLLTLKEHEGIPIVRPVDFLRMVAGAPK